MVHTFIYTLYNEIKYQIHVYREDYSLLSAKLLKDIEYLRSKHKRPSHTHFLFYLKNCLCEICNIYGE